MHVESLHGDGLGARDSGRATRHVLGGDGELVRLLMHEDVATGAHEAVVGAVKRRVVRISTCPTHACNVAVGAKHSIYSNSLRLVKLHCNPSSPT